MCSYSDDVATMAMFAQQSRNAATPGPLTGAYSSGVYSSGAASSTKGATSPMRQSPHGSPPTSYRDATATTGYASLMYDLLPVVVLECFPVAAVALLHSRHRL